jgi:hypothetical protein
MPVGQSVVKRKGDGSIFSKNRTVPLSSFSWFLEFHRQGQLIPGFENDRLSPGHFDPVPFLLEDRGECLRHPE